MSGLVLARGGKSCYHGTMQTPTIVKQTKEYLIVKIPLPRQAATAPQSLRAATRTQKANGTLTLAEKRLGKTLRESERDMRAGHGITARNITEALRRYEKRQWD